MYLHRIIEIAGFAADTDWSAEQVPPDAVLPTGGSLIRADSSGGMIYWTAIPYNGADLQVSQPSDGTGLTFDARLVYTQPSVFAGGAGRDATLVIGRKSPGEVEGSPIDTGREVIEPAPPKGTAGTLQMLSLAGAAPPGTTHLWLFWSFESRGVY